MAVRFINCDLKIESPRSLEYLLADFLGTVVNPTSDSVAPSSGRTPLVRRAAALGASIAATIYTRDIADLDEDCPPHEETADGRTVH